jgi:hypothetical protein
MSGRVCVAFTLSLALAGLTAAAEKKLDAVIYGPYFEKNTSGLKPDKEDSSYLVFKDKAAFDKVFGSGRVMKQKPKLLDKGDFDKNLVIAVIKRGKQIHQYTVEGVTVDDGKVRIAYKADPKGGAGGTARFASPLVVAIPKGDYKSVEFVENKKARETITIGK